MTVVGRVPDMATELARADVVVVPVRFGSGTRLKILEAFAHRVPVVSTTIGAEGLGVEDRTHLLIADRPEEFADAIYRLRSSPTLHRRIVDAAEEFYARALRVVGGRGTGPGARTPTVRTGSDDPTPGPGPPVT